MGAGNDEALRLAELYILKHSQAVMIENFDVTDATGALIDVRIERDKIIFGDQPVSGLVQLYLNILKNRSMPVA
jgi:hypothetical protein